MPSHLTRHVFRRILANEPIIHRGCLRRQAHTTARRVATSPRRSKLHDGAYTIARQQRRAFFNFNMFKGKKAEAKEADIDPGIEDMMQLAKLQRMRARLPPPEDIVVAFAKFFKHKIKLKQPISDTQAELALVAWKYCVMQQRDVKIEIPGDIYLWDILYTLKRSKSSPTTAHLRLVEALLATVRNARPGSSVHTDFEALLVAILASSGQSSQAREHLLEYEKSELGSESDPSLSKTRGDVDRAKLLRNLSAMWASTLHGFALDNNEAELLKTLDMIRDRTWLDKQKPAIPAAMLQFYLLQSHPEQIRLWFLELWQAYSRLFPLRATGSRRLGTEMLSALQWCLKHDELELGHEIVRQAMSDNPPKDVWDAVFVWAASTGKGADEIDRMLDVMEKSNEAISNLDEWRLPDIATINKLVEYATSKGDPYLAERFISLGKARNIEPDARTFQLQMDYRLKIHDVDGALIAYKSLQAMDTSSNDDLPTVNRLIVAMCKGRRHDFDTIMNVAMDLSDRRARFEPQTVSTLALLHLNRDEVHDVIDLLNTHAYHYSSTEREAIRDDVLAFCLDPKTPTSRAWDAYTVIRVIFEETPRPQRTEMLKSFFARKRPDMAVSLFHEMRKHSRTDTMPTVDTYAASFMGSAKLRDLESLEVIHNQLKLDYNIDVNTYLTNALMIAYTACGQPRKAVGFWNDIVASKEGPTFNSIHIALRACEKAPFGDLRAKELWEKLRKMNLDLDQSMWASYVAALAGNGDNELAIKTVEEAEAKSELEFDAFLVGSLYDGAQNDSKQVEIEEWAKEKYPNVWEELERIGYDINEETGLKSFRIDRTVTP